MGYSKWTEERHKEAIILEKARKDFPPMVDDDGCASVDDLVFKALCELDLMLEQPEEYDYMTKAEFRSFKGQIKRYIKKYSKYVSNKGLKKALARERLI